MPISRLTSYAKMALENRLAGLWLQTLRLGGMFFNHLSISAYQLIHYAFQYIQMFLGKFLPMRISISAFQSILLPSSKWEPIGVDDFTPTAHWR